MTEYSEKKCPKCGQLLRFPKDVGGMLMACPTCGNKFHSDFKLGGIKKNTHQGIPATVFGMPNKIMSRIIRYFIQK